MSPEEAGLPGIVHLNFASDEATHWLRLYKPASSGLRRQPPQAPASSQRIARGVKAIRLRTGHTVSCMRPRRCSIC